MRSRIVRGGLAALIVASTVLAGVASPAVAAGSAMGIAQNAWIVTDLAVQAGQAVAQSPEVTAYERSLASTATVGTTAASAGVQARPRAGGKLGMIVNTVGVLGGLALYFVGGESAEELPEPASTPAYNGDNRCGFTSGGDFGGTVQCINADAQGHPGSIRAGQSSSAVAWRAAGGYGWHYTVSQYPGAYFGMNINYSFFDASLQDTPGGTTARIYRSPTSTLCNGYCTGNLPVGSQLTTTITIPQHYTTMQNPQPGNNPDPAILPRYIESEINCKSASGATQTIARRDGPFTIDPSNPAGTLSPEVPDMTCPEGTWLSGGKRDLSTDGTTETIPLVEPYAAPDWVAEQAGQFPECFPVGNIMCQLEVYKLKTTSPNDDLSCNSIPAAASHPCRQWASDPDRNEKYDCRFGPYTSPMRACLAFKDIFTTDILVGSPPEETPPEDVPPTDPTPEQTPDQSECVPGMGPQLLNPWWVYKAMKCAFAWAFKPQTALSTRLNRLRTDLATRIPFAWFSGFAAFPGAVPNNGCPDWEIKVAGETKSIVCDSSYIAMLRAGRPVFAVFMGALAIWPLVRSTAYAAFPIIKPTPGVLR